MFSTAQKPTGSATSALIDITQSLRKYITNLLQTHEYAWRVIIDFITQSLTLFWHSISVNKLSKLNVLTYTMQLCTELPPNHTTLSELVQTSPINHSCLTVLTFLCTGSCILWNSIWDLCDIYNIFIVFDILCESRCVAVKPNKRLQLLSLLLLVQSLAVWCSGNGLVLINAVALHRARLVLGCVTAFG